jgi:hypothetical protein
MCLVFKWPKRYLVGNTGHKAHLVAAGVQRGHRSEVRAGVRSLKPRRQLFSLHSPAAQMERERRYRHISRTYSSYRSIIQLNGHASLRSRSLSRSAEQRIAWNRKQNINGGIGSAVRMTEALTFAKRRVRDSCSMHRCVQAFLARKLRLDHL